MRTLENMAEASTFQVEIRGIPSAPRAAPGPTYQYTETHSGVDYTFRILPYPLFNILKCGECGACKTYSFDVAYAYECLAHDSTCAGFRTAVDTMSK